MARKHETLWESQFDDFSTMYKSGNLFVDVSSKKIQKENGNIEIYEESTTLYGLLFIWNIYIYFTLVIEWKAYLGIYLKNENLLIISIPVAWKIVWNKSFLKLTNALYSHHITIINTFSIYKQ